MSVMYARNDVRSISVAEAHGGCGIVHERETGPDGRPSDLFFVDCPQCESFLLADPLWARTLDDVPESPDEARARLAFESRGAKALTSLRALALAKMAGLDAGEVSPELRAMITAGPVRVPGVTVCESGHDNSPGSRYCSTCGRPMSGPAAKASLPSGDSQ
jgi:hypothetical protein